MSTFLSSESPVRMHQKHNRWIHFRQIFLCVAETHAIFLLFHMFLWCSFTTNALSYGINERNQNNRGTKALRILIFLWRSKVQLSVTPSYFRTWISPGLLAGIFRFCEIYWQYRTAGNLVFWKPWPVTSLLSFDVRKSWERQASKKFSKILYLKSSSEQISSKKLTLGAPGNLTWLRPVSNVVLLPCRTQLIELNSTLARQ